MGEIHEDTGLGPTVWAGDGEEWIELTISLGTNAKHVGIALGRADDDDAVARLMSLLSASLQGGTALGAAINALPTLTTGPWPGIVPATWLAGLNPQQQGRILTRVRSKARAVARL